MENAADTLLVVVRFDGVADLGGGGGSGIDVREGGVSGAPNMALSDGVLSGARGA